MEATAAARHLATSGLGPALLHTDKRHGWLALAWFDGQPVGTGHADDVLTALARWDRPHPDPDRLTPLHPWLRDRLASLPADRNVRWPSPSPWLRRHALHLLHTLPDERRVCHGDFHGDNVLRSTGGQMQAVDPRGVCGPVEWDVATFIGRSAVAHSHGRPTADTATLDAVARAGFDVALVCDWLTVHVAAQT